MLTTSFGVDDMRTACALALWLLTMAPSPVNATPYQDNFIGVTINKHPWGFWRVVDVPLDPDQRPYGFAANGQKVQFVTYWCLGFGPYARFQVSQGLGFLMIVLAAAFAGYKIYHKPKKTEQTAPPSGAPGTPPCDPGVAEGPPSPS